MARSRSTQSVSKNPAVLRALSRTIDGVYMYVMSRCTHSNLWGGGQLFSVGSVSSATGWISE